MFFSVITNSLNWEISTKNLVTFKRWEEVKDAKGLTKKSGEGCFGWNVLFFKILKNMWLFAYTRKRNSENNCKNNFSIL